MSPFAICNARVHTAAGLQSGVAVQIDGRQIVAVLPERDLPPGIARVDLGGRLLAPGYIDVQVNGGAGRMFNDAPTVDTLAAMGRDHARFGTTGFLPTVITDRIEVVEAGMAAVKAAISAGVPGVLGIHVEGPFLNPDYAGIHDAALFRPLDEAAFRLLTTADAGRVVVTLAPERVDASMIDRLVRAGVRVSIGHSSATYAQAMAAFAAGATGVTHLFNAMSALASREPGLVGAALESEAYCGLIVDGQHVDPAVLRIALRAKRDRRFMLVTDAMASVDDPASRFVFQNRPIHAQGNAFYDDDGRLAGSALSMSRAVQCAVALLGLDPAEAWTMASANPAAFLGLEQSHGAIAAGRRADFVVLDDRLEVRQTWIGGQTVFDRGPGAEPPDEAPHGG
jgi:N-acetylglucosamine-6-phosphate deacetylase